MDRSYRQFCGVARALDLLGGRWTLLIVRNLLLGPRRYSTLLAELPGITTNLLANRLQHLEAAGLVARVDDEGHSAWSLTPEGALLEPVVMELGRFGARTLKTPRRGERVDVAWGLLSLKRRYRGGLSTSVELRVDDNKDPRSRPAEVRLFTLDLGPRYLRVRDRAAVAPALVVSAKADVFRAIFFAGAAAADFVDSGALVVAGADDAWRAFLGAFSPVPLPHTGGADPDADRAAVDVKVNVSVNVNDVDAD